METYISKPHEFGEHPTRKVQDNTEPSLESNLLEGVTTIEAIPSGLAETLEVTVSRSVNSSNAPTMREAAFERSMRESVLSGNIESWINSPTALKKVVTFSDPVSKHEIVSNGYLGNILGTQINMGLAA